MRYYFNGSGFTVSFNAQDSRDFGEDWPCSTVEGKGFFGFTANDDLIDAGGSALGGDGDDWLAFSRDCQKYGEPKFKKDQKKDTFGKQLAKEEG